MACTDYHACLDYLACPERDLAENRKAIAPPSLPPVVKSGESDSSVVVRERQRRERAIPGSIETDLQPAAEGSKAVSSPRQPADLKNLEPGSLSSGNETSITSRGNQRGKETQHPVLSQQPTHPAVEQTPGQPAAASGSVPRVGKEALSSLFNEPSKALESAQATASRRELPKAPAHVPPPTETTTTPAVEPHEILAQEREPSSTSSSNSAPSAVTETSVSESTVPKSPDAEAMGKRSAPFNPAKEQPQPARRTSPDPLDALFEPAEQGQPKATPTVAPPTDHLNVRRWRDHTGHFTCQAQLLRVTASAVQLVKATGRITTVPLARLSDQDLRFVSSYLHARRVSSGRDQSVHSDRETQLAVQADSAQVGH